VLVHPHSSGHLQVEGQIPQFGPLQGSGKLKIE